MGRPSTLVAAISVTLVSLELTWTRLFSAEFFYTFAFLILSLAVLGLGLGALAVRLGSTLERESTVGWLLTGTGLAGLAGPPLVFALDVDMSRILGDPLALARWALALLLLGAAFLFGGMALALLFRRGWERIPRLYMADLLGAGLGVQVAFLAMNRLGTPTATFAITLPVLLAASVTLRGWRRAVPVVSMLLAILLGETAGGLLRRDREERAPVIYEHWDAMAKIKLYDFGEGYRGLEIDNAANSPVYEFDGNWDRPDSLRFEFGIDVQFLMDRFDSCTFLSLGSGGGTDVLQALQGGCTEIHAVEVVPHVNHMMIDGELAGFTGRIYEDPRVHVATEDARAYVRRHPGRFDIIYSLSSNTFAALASGAFAMAENYLFTVEAFQDYWTALTDDGFLMMEHQFYGARLVAEALEGLRELGVENVQDHLAVYALPQMRREMILLSKRPLTDELRAFGYGTLGPDLDETIHLLWPPPERHAGNRVEKIVREGWRSAAAESDIDLSPCRDDRPYTAQLGRWRNFRTASFDRVSPLQEVQGFPLAKLLVLLSMGVVLLGAVPLCLLPCFREGEKLRPVSWLYFFVLGMAFMMAEVVLIQKYTFFIGPAVHGIATILLALLIGSGIGSRLAPRVDARVAFLAILAWLILDVSVFRGVIDGLTTWTMRPRMLITAGLVAPLGLFMGMPFPKGGLRVGPLVDWGYAVNGAASVLGSSLAVLLAFTYGFGPTLLLTAVLYAVAGGLYARRSAW